MVRWPLNKSVQFLCDTMPLCRYDEASELQYYASGQWVHMPLVEKVVRVTLSLGLWTVEECANPPDTTFSYKLPGASDARRAAVLRAGGLLRITLRMARLGIMHLGPHQGPGPAPSAQALEQCLQVPAPVPRRAVWLGPLRLAHRDRGGEGGGKGARIRKCGEACGGRPERGGDWAEKTVKRPPQQPAQPWSANYCAPRTRKRHHKEHRPSESIDPTRREERVPVQGPVKKPQPRFARSSASTRTQTRHPRSL